METNQKILLVEDDTFIARIYSRVFSLSGFSIELAQNGEEVFTKLEAMSPLPVIIILDIMIPKLSGFDVLKRLKADDKLKNIPVIVMTNLSEKSDSDKALSLGAALYLIKSNHSPKEVMDNIKKLIAQHPPQV